MRSYYRASKEMRPRRPRQVTLLEEKKVNNQPTITYATVTPSSKHRLPCWSETCQSLDEINYRVLKVTFSLMYSIRNPFFFQVRAHHVLITENARRH